VPNYVESAIVSVRLQTPQLEESSQNVKCELLYLEEKNINKYMLG
jgi:hypothetical protein